MERTLAGKSCTAKVYEHFLHLERRKNLCSRVRINGLVFICVTRDSRSNDSNPFGYEVF